MKRKLAGLLAGLTIPIATSLALWPLIGLADAVTITLAIFAAGSLVSLWAYILWRSHKIDQGPRGGQDDA